MLFPVMRDNNGAPAVDHSKQVQSWGIVDGMKPLVRFSEADCIGDTTQGDLRHINSYYLVQQTMNITLTEIQDILRLSRAQISRYTTSGRLTRTSQGRYDAAGLANLVDPYQRQTGHQYPDEERDIWRVRSEHSFRRSLFGVIATRHLISRTAPRPDDDELCEIEKAVSDFARILKARPD